MIQNILIWVIIAICAFFVGRRFYYQIKAARSGKPVSCCDDCSCCSEASAIQCSAERPVKKETTTN